MSSARRHQAFWRHSLRLYAAAGVAPACLALQDDHGIDVNLLLLCCWLGSQGRRLGLRDMRAAMTAVAAWQSGVVQPLRAARRALKPMAQGALADVAPQLRQKLSRLELEAEFQEHELLLRWAESRTLTCRPDAPQATTAANLRTYLRLMGVPDERMEATLTAFGVNQQCQAPVAPGSEVAHRKPPPRRAR
ncbi:MAG: TIGR02444 family protein [Aquabacterium sp.]|nr:TIGR02444 family protein [Aquabacterium sp.]